MRATAGTTSQPAKRSVRNEHDWQCLAVVAGPPNPGCGFVFLPTCRRPINQQKSKREQTWRGADGKQREENANGLFEGQLNSGTSKMIV